MQSRILRFISIAIISTCTISTVRAQQPNSKEEAIEKVKDALERPVPFFDGIIVGVDLVGPAMKAIDADYAQMEASMSINLKQKYYPTFEMGYGETNYVDEETSNGFKTKAPYFRLGVDYNFLKKKNTGNRLYLGLRYGFCNFTYDVEAPNLTDPVWGDATPINIEGQKSTNHWMEMVFGLDTRLWKFVHVGWNIRCKFRMSQSSYLYGEPWYVPGFGKNDSSCFGGTFNLLFNI